MKILSNVSEIIGEPMAPSGSGSTAQGGGKSRANAPVFVIGCHHSGTALLCDSLLSAGGCPLFHAAPYVHTALLRICGNPAVRRNREKLISLWLRSKAFRRTGLATDDQESGAGAFNPVNRWKTKLSQPEIQTLEATIGDCLEEFAYPLTTERGSSVGLDSSLRLMRILYPYVFRNQVISAVQDIDRPTGEGYQAGTCGSCLQMKPTQLHFHDNSRIRVVAGIAGR